MSASSSNCVPSVTADPLAEDGRLSGGEGGARRRLGAVEPDGVRLLDVGVGRPEELGLRGLSFEFVSCSLLSDVSGDAMTGEPEGEGDSNVVGSRGVESGLGDRLRLPKPPFGGCGKDPMLTVFLYDCRIPRGRVGSAAVEGEVSSAFAVLGRFEEDCVAGTLNLLSGDGVFNLFAEFVRVGKDEPGISLFAVAEPGVSGNALPMRVFGNGGRGMLGGGDGIGGEYPIKEAGEEDAVESVPWSVETVVWESIAVAVEDEEREEEGRGME